MGIVRTLRKNPTESERALWRRLRQRQFIGFKFRRQHLLGSYIVDFVCLEKKLIIEVDGGQHAECADDMKRTCWLENRGFHVLRFWNNQVLTRTFQLEARTENEKAAIFAKQKSSNIPVGMRELFYEGKMAAFSFEFRSPTEKFGLSV